MAETDLYPPVKRFLEAQGYEVKGEVRDCDVVALRGGEPPVIVELKTVFSLALLMQGVDRQAISDAVYLAIAPPKRQSTSDMLKLCKRLGLGLLIVSGEWVEPLADPAPYMPRKNAKRKSMLLKEFAHRVGDPNLGGGNKRPQVTAYRQDALRCVIHLNKCGPSKVAHIRNAVGVARAASILQSDVYGWFARQQRGIYALTPKGEAALSLFGDVVRVL